MGIRQIVVIVLIMSSQLQLVEKIILVQRWSVYFCIYLFECLSTAIYFHLVLKLTHFETFFMKVKFDMIVWHPRVIHQI